MKESLLFVKNKFSALVGIFALALFWVILGITQKTSIDSDFAWQLFEANKFLQGKFTLIGPASSLGFHFGPYYYFQLAVALFFADRNLEAIVAINSALTFLPYLAGLLLLLRRYENRYVTKSTVLRYMILGITGASILMFTHGSSAHSYLGMVFLFGTILQYLTSQNKLFAFFLGLMAGIIANYHLVAVFLLLYFFLEIKKPNLEKLVPFMFCGFILAFFPVILFEIRHDFVSWKVILQGGLSNFVENANLTYYQIPSSFTEAYMNLSLLMRQYFYFPIELVFIFVGANFYRFTKSKLQFEKLLPSIYFLVLFTFILKLSFSQFAPHYFFPLGFVALAIGLNFIEDNFKKSAIILAIIIGIYSLLSFSFQKNIKSDEAFYRQREYVESVVKHQELLVHPINVVYFKNSTQPEREANILRFLLTLRGIRVLERGELNQAKSLVIVDEQNSDILSNSFYEVNSFASSNNRKLQEIDSSSKAKIYLLSRID